MGPFSFVWSFRIGCDSGNKTGDAFLHFVSSLACTTFICTYIIISVAASATAASLYTTRHKMRFPINYLYRFRIYYITYLQVLLTELRIRNTRQYADERVFCPHIRIGS